VGGNIGLFLIRINQRLRTGRVLVFEPIPAIYEVLQENARRHNHLDLCLLNVGLSSSAGDVSFAFFPKAPPDSTMHPDLSDSARAQQRAFIRRVLDGDSSIRLSRLARAGLAITPGFAKSFLAELIRRRYMASCPVPCRVKPLSTIIDDYGIQGIDLLKMDVEGAEFEVLAGLRPDHWPLLRQVVLEVHGGPPAAERMSQLLEGRGLTTHAEVDPLRPNNFMVYARRRPLATAAGPGQPPETETPWPDAGRPQTPRAT